MKSCFQLVFFTTILIGVSVLGGCLPSDIGMGYMDTEETTTPTGIDRLYSEADSDLILSIPSDLTIEDQEIAQIYRYAKEISHCRNSSGEPIPIMLAEACLLYDYYYLFPDYLPANLDSIDTAKNYVDFMRQSDRFTFYYSPEAFSEYKLFQEGESAHIGFRYYVDGEMVSEQTPFLIEEVYPYTRAWIDGLQAGDKVISVNGTAISGLLEEEAINLFPNWEGAAVDLLVQRNDQQILISTAAEEHIALLIAPGTAYLNLRSFTLNTGTEVKRDFQNLKASSTVPITKIILDLRDNSGGSNAGTLQLVDFLIDQDTPARTNPIMTLDGTVYQNSGRYLGDYELENIGDYSESSLVVLVDGSSASAAEVTTAVLKFYHEATIMGMQTYGKGVSQIVFELVDGSGIWVTAHYIYPPDGVSFHLTGITPDYVITDSPASFSQDPLLEKALVFLDTGIVAAAGSTKEQLGQPILTKKAAESIEERFIGRGKFWK